MSNFNIYLSFVAFDDGLNGKIRPVLILESDEIYLFPITSQFDNKSDYIKKHYYKIIDWQEAGLDKQSYIDTLNIQILDKKPTNKFIGSLSQLDIKLFNQFLINF